MKHIKNGSKGDFSNNRSQGGLKEYLKRYGVGATVSGLLISNAHAAKVDVTAATTSLVDDGTTAISAIGMALITLAGVAVVFKWVKAAFFG